MRKAIVFVAVLFACAKSETAQNGMSASANVLTPAAIAGTWTGVSMAEGSDSVLNHWTATSVSDMEGNLVIEGSPDTVHYTMTFDADSFVATSTPYSDPSMPTGPKLIFRSVGRLQDGKLVGTSTNMLADKPDSIVSHDHFSGSKAP